ncbi:MAG TPA: hypothetical protein VFG33_14475 [Kribbella sp.]|uniref:hypothetical protein n=1 Tax=Kribbella sp. TaxID=1871183 RepID=UPI002D77D154|nr:hypothetical protein [Kribbella sp.]HET6294586.1 hypothetical protein [Kribbella sp.]
MTAQHLHDHNLDLRQADAEHDDPIGPVTLPMRTKVGARALGLVAGASAAALAMQAVLAGASTDTTI